MSITAELPTRRNEAWKYSDLRKAVGEQTHVLRDGRDIIERLAPGTQRLDVKAVESLLFVEHMDDDRHMDARSFDRSIGEGGSLTRVVIHAIKMAVAGDTIYLEPKVYRDYAGFYGKKGEPGKPNTMDGHGATLERSDPIDPAKWREVSPGLFADDDLMPGLSDAAIGRWFFLFDGKMQLMGRTSKGRSAALKKPEELQAGEWTFVKDPSREKPPSQAIYGSFFLKLAAGQSLAEAKIFAPMRSAGVQMSGDNAPPRAQEPHGHASLQ